MTRSLCVWGVGAQRVRGYGCTSNAPASHIVPRISSIRKPRPKPGLLSVTVFVRAA